MPMAGADFPREVDHGGVLEHLPRQRDDRCGHRRAEEERLTLGRDVAENPLDVGQEAHVEHPVGLVEDEDLETGELGVGLLHVVEQATGRCHDDVDAAPERVFLGVHPHAAVDGGSRDRRVHREVVDVFQDLQGEFAGRTQDQRPGGSALQFHEPLQDGEDEGGGLAAAGHGAGQEVTPLKRRGDRFGLDRGGTGEPELLDALEQVGMQVQCGERHGVPC